MKRLCCFLACKQVYYIYSRKDMYYLELFYYCYCFKDVHFSEIEIDKAPMIYKVFIQIKLKSFPLYCVIIDSF